MLRLFRPLLLALALGTCGRAQEGPPNVLLIYTDDHRFSGVHALGNMPVQTPHLDALVADGVAFTNTFLMGSFSGATCIPSRAMLHTGRHLFHLQGNGHTIPPAHTMLGEAFARAGYNGHAIGKWHQDPASLNRAFATGDRLMGLGAYLVDHFRMPLWDYDPTGTYPRPAAYLLENGPDGVRRRPLRATDARGPSGTAADGPHTSEVFAGSAEEYLTSYRDTAPFFLYLAFHAPHDPRQAPAAYRARYPVDSIRLPPSYLPQHPFDNGHLVLRDEALAPWPRTPAISRRELADYYAIITHLDEQIGRVIAALRASGQYENTLIVFAGDSGLAVGNHGLLGKQNLYDEDGLHVPFVLAGGRVADKGRRIDALAYIHDIFPTLCDLANVPIPGSVDGRSLAPLLRDPAATGRPSTYHAYRQFQRAYREGDFKLIEYVRAKTHDRRYGTYFAGSRVTQLFNVREDPWETRDLSFFPVYRDTVARLRSAMRARARVLGDAKENVAGEAYDFWDYFRD